MIGRYILCVSISEAETRSLENCEQKKPSQAGVNGEIITDLAVQQTQFLIALLYCSKQLEIKLNIYLYPTEHYVHNINIQRTSVCTLLILLKRQNIFI